VTAYQSSDADTALVRSLWASLSRHRDHLELLGGVPEDVPVAVRRHEHGVKRLFRHLRLVVGGGEGVAGVDFGEVLDEDLVAVGLAFRDAVDEPVHRQIAGHRIAGQRADGGQERLRQAVGVLGRGFGALQPTLDLDGFDLREQPSLGKLARLDHRLDRQLRTDLGGRLGYLVDDGERFGVALSRVHRKGQTALEFLDEFVSEPPLVGVRCRRAWEGPVEVLVDVSHLLFDRRLVDDHELDRPLDGRVLIEEALDGADATGLVSVNPADDRDLGCSRPELCNSHYPL
jgi:hypothetical protein